MALKTEIITNRTTGKKTYKTCNPNDIAIPKKIIEYAKQKGKIIENAYKKYGPGVINNLRSIGKGDEPLKNFIKIIENPYKTLCFYESYFEYTRNFQEIDKIFEKARKTLETAAKRSKNFSDAFNNKKIIYNKKAILGTSYDEDPNDNKDGTKIDIIKNGFNQPVPKFALYCALIINRAYEEYQTAHDKFHELKEQITKKIEHNDTYKAIIPASKEAHKAFKENLYKLPPKIDKLYKKANSYKYTLQTKKFTSNELDELMNIKKQIQEEADFVYDKLRTLSSLKYGSNSNIMYTKNTIIDSVYNQASKLQDQLTYGKIDYSEIQKEIDNLIEYTDKMAESINKLELNNGIKENKKITVQYKDLSEIIGQLKDFTNKINKDTQTINTMITKIDKAIDEFQESYTLWSWTKWIFKKTGISLLSLTKALHSLMLNLTKYNESLKFVKDIGEYVIGDGDNPLFYAD